MKRLFILVLACLLIVFSGCDTKTVGDADTSERKTEAVANKENIGVSVSKEKETIVDMFIQYGTYCSDGWYRFSKNQVQGNVAFGYAFGYNPNTDTFISSCLVTTYSTALSVVLSDYGSVLFQWGNLKNAYFSGDHRLEDNAHNILGNIDFEYYADNLNASTYKVTSNTYSQLSKNEINEYAKTSFECLEQGMIYAQSVISAYTDNITLR